MKYKKVLGTLLLGHLLGVFAGSGWSGDSSIIKQALLLAPIGMGFTFTPYLWGINAVLVFLLALAQLITLCVLGKSKNSPRLILFGVLVFSVVCSFLGTVGLAMVASV